MISLCLMHAFRLLSSCDLCTLQVFPWPQVHEGDFILTFLPLLLIVSSFFNLPPDISHKQTEDYKLNIFNPKYVKPYSFNFFFRVVRLQPPSKLLLCLETFLTIAKYCHRVKDSFLLEKSKTLLEQDKTMRPQGFI